MSKWLCQLPWLSVCGAMVAYGLLTFAALVMPPRTQKDIEHAGAGLIAFIFGTVGLVAWAVVAFAVK